MPQTLAIQIPASSYAVTKRKTSLPKIIWEKGCGAVAHVHHKVIIGYSGMPQIRPNKYPFPWIDPQTPLPASSLDPSDLWRQMASGSDPPFFHNAMDRQTDARMYRPTDRPRESLMTIGCCAMRVMRPNNNNNNNNNSNKIATRWSAVAILHNTV